MLNFAVESISKTVFDPTIKWFGLNNASYYIDSSCLPVCHLMRSKRHKVFDTTAHYGRTSVGWFFGLKLHIVTNNRGELMAFKVTRGHRNDGKEAPSLLKTLKGLAFGDKGYLGKKLFEELFSSEFKLITRKQKNMKESPELSAYERPVTRPAWHHRNSNLAFKTWLSGLAYEVSFCH